MLMNVLAAGNPLTHVVDHAWIRRGDFTLLSNHIIIMLVAAVLTMVLVPLCLRVPQTADEVERLTPRGKRNFMEVICEFLRDFVARPNLGPHTDAFMPYVWTVFFFILMNNLLGLLPLEPLTKPVVKALTGIDHGIYGTPTGNIWVTGTLAATTLIMIVFNGLRTNGLGYVKHFFMGPFPINLLIAVLEVIGLFAKSFALAIRLFANMMAGHILLAVLLMFIAMAFSAGALLGVVVAVPVVLGSVAINMLELFVAFLQAFIFTFLSCVFIGQAVNIHHEEEHHEHHGEEAGPAHAAGHGHEKEPTPAH
ncbi:MAG TPA: F0F1 ATP synthase subunit A [Phycisphaerae bacterium]|jgi:F-type H+-transporting ATPase subunit a|nr:F0F1 ATP synthase subunit A [Phycisphaerae bacterium]HOB75230.1 F0F1 ATP synthase subunit A [Phycisphaerae bacterium]HOJ54711.1 F0F1 ATP synthase subunit A [Phycisphaerae bacterium]HOL25939.1 F0F1 ATP synthase subunit A [Phycisphaerae bacterium]HPP19489.1 F0F1 ATP synthase subunit A [Phycisphaerae bacterium]